MVYHKHVIQIPRGLPVFQNLVIGLPFKTFVGYHNIRPLVHIAVKDILNDLHIGGLIFVAEEPEGMGGLLLVFVIEYFIPAACAAGHGQNSSQGGGCQSG